MIARGVTPCWDYVTPLGYGALMRDEAREVCNGALQVGNGAVEMGCEGK